MIHESKPSVSFAPGVSPWEFAFLACVLKWPGEAALLASR